CPICGQSTTDLRSHVGMHILRAKRGVAEVVTQPIVGSEPCGFCGRNGEPEGALSFKETKRKAEWKTQCPHAHPFQYTSTYKGSDNRPCRNVPLVCKLC
ncbi:hypothetical protein BS17DRAFT_638965, partial [Gyrodon lividus]